MSTRDSRRGDGRSSERRRSSRPSRSRSRSRSRDRKRARDRSRSRDRDHKPDRDATAAAATPSAPSSSSRDLEHRLKAAKKLLRSGAADALQQVQKMLSEGELEELLAEANSSTHKDERKDKKKKKEKKKDRKRSRSRSRDKHQRRQESDSDSSDEADKKGDSDDAPATLSDGVTPRLRPSDYFARSTEFRLWLHSQKKHLDELPSDEAKRLFADKFVKLWNERNLPAELYRGLDTASISKQELTGFRWSFAKSMSSRDQDALQRARDEIDTSTNHGVYEAAFGRKIQALEASGGAAAGANATEPVASGARSFGAELPPGRR